MKTLKRFPLPILLLSVFCFMLTWTFLSQLNESKRIAHLIRHHDTLSTTAVNKAWMLIGMRKGADFVQVKVLQHVMARDTIERKFEDSVIESEVSFYVNQLNTYQQLPMTKEERFLFDSLKYYRQQNARIRGQLLRDQPSANGITAEQIYDQQQKAYEQFQYYTTLLTSLVQKESDGIAKDFDQKLKQLERRKRMNELILLGLMLAIASLIVWIILKLRQLNLQLEERKEQYRILLENTGELITKCDKEGRLVFGNRAFKEKMELTDVELCSLRVPDILCKEVHSNYDSIPTPETHGTKQEDFSTIFCTRRGKKIFVEGNIVLNYKKDRFESAEAFFRDITERKLLQDQLIASEHKYKTIFNASPLPMWFVDPDTMRFVEVNEAAVENYGYEREEFERMTPFDLRPAEEQEAVNALLMQLLDTNQYYEAQGHHLKKNGQQIDVEISGRVMILNEKRQILIVAKDVTERNEVDRQVSRAIIKGQEQERNTIGTELHDNVCQIIASGQLALSLVRNGVQSDVYTWWEKANEMLQLALDEIRSLSHQLAPPILDNRSFASTVNNLLNDMNVGHRWTVRFHFDNELLEDELDPDLQLNLYRILQEQLRNITRHAEATAISVVLSKNNACVMMNIADNGKGFEMENIKNGIGFRNIKKRAELFCGDMIIDSASGKGCSVTVIIPENS